MISIKIHRTREQINIMRDYKIYIDGQKVGTISNGETKEFPITSGQHSLVAKIDWCSSSEIPINVNENDTITLKVEGFKNANWIMLVGLGLIILHIILNHYLDFGYTIFLILPVFLWVLYYMTFGRKKYLTLSKIE